MDRHKQMLVHASTTVKPSYVRVLVALAAIFGLKLWSKTLTLSCIQGAERILRQVYVKQKPEFQLSTNELLQILRPMYCFSDSGEYWHSTFLKFLKIDLKMGRVAGDLSFFPNLMHGKIEGLIATHVDDTLVAGTKDFNQAAKRIEDRFDAKPREESDITFAGIHIEENEACSFTLHQGLYAERLKALRPDCTFEQFRSRRHKIAWLDLTRPDVQADTALLAQITKETFTSHVIKNHHQVDWASQEGP